VQKIVLSLSLAALVAPTFAEDKITYVDQVLPILRNACLKSHNPDKKKAGLDMTTYAATMTGSENGPILKPGQADASLLFKVCAQTEDPKMPPKGDKLTDAELAVLKGWIAGFALETATSKPAAVQNTVALAVVSLERPAGPPPMPGDLPLEPFVRPKANTAVTALAVSPWAPLVAIGGQKQVTLYNTETLQQVGVLPFPEGFPAVIKFSRNGQLLLIGGGLGGKSGKVTLWNVVTGQRVGSVGDEQDQVLAADVSPDHGHVALGGPSKTLKIFSTKDGKLLTTIKRHTEWVTAVAFSPDGKFLASGDRNGGVMVWEGATGKEYNSLPGHKQMVTALAFMPGILASASTEGKITLWDVKEAKEIRSWAAHNAGVEWIDFTPDGRLVSCGRDKLAKVWDQNGKVIGTSPAFADIALRAGLSNDRIIATDWTGRIQVCKLDGSPVGELTANPAPIAEQLAATEKRLNDTKAALPGLQQAAAAAEQKLKADKDAIEAKHKVDIAAAQKTQDDAQKAIEAGKAQVAAQEKRVADLHAEGEQLKAASNAATQAVEAAKKIAAEKKTANATDPAAEQDVVAKTAAAAEAAKSLAANPPALNAAQAEVQKAKAQLPKTVATSEKTIAEAKKLLAALNTPPAPKPLPSEEALAKAKAAVDEATATIASATSNLEHWRRAQAFMGVHRAENSYAELKAKHEELIATAKDAFGPVEQVRAQIAALTKSTTEAPAAIAKAQAEAAATAKTLDVADKANTAATNDTKAKEAAASVDPKAVEGEIAAAQKKLDGLNAEIAKRREARAKTQEGTPEYQKADVEVQGIKPEIAAAEKLVADAKAKLADATAKRAALAAAQEAQKKANDAENAAHDKSLAAQRALTKLQQTAEAETKQLADLIAKEPKMAQDAAVTKTKAEQEAGVIAKQLDPAKEAATKVRAEFEAKWHPNKQASAN
jgi:WD40 repeat protein